MGDISKHFSAHELECPCCGGIDMDKEFLDWLDNYRDLLGRPIRPSSGYRCISHNAKCGGSPTSKHIQGTAADLPYRNGKELVDMVRLAITLGALGIGVYEKHIHVDIDPSRNAQVMWWG